MQLKPRDDDNENENDTELSGTGFGESGSKYVGDGMPSNNDYLGVDPDDPFADLRDDYMGSTSGTAYYNSSESSGSGIDGTGGVPGGITNDAFYDVGNEPVRILTKKEFFDRIDHRKDRDRIILSAVFIIATAIAGVIRVQFWLQTFERQIEYLNNMSETLGISSEYQIDTAGILRNQIIVAVVLIGLGVGILVIQSRACAVTGLVLSLINLIASFVQYHRFSGYLVVLAFGYATMSTFNMYSAWQRYQQNPEKY